MNNYSTEKVLEWVNSSEARATKYEQEAKDLRRQIDMLEEKILDCQSEIHSKYDAAEEMERRMENLEVSVVKRREGMGLLQQLFDDKLEEVQSMEIKVSILNGTYLNEAFQESLKPSSFVNDVTAIADGGVKHNFLEIQNITQTFTKEEDPPELELLLKRQQIVQEEYKDIKKLQSELKTKAINLERMFKEKRAKLRMSLSSHSREKEKLKKFSDKISSEKLAV